MVNQKLLSAGQMRRRQARAIMVPMKRNGADRRRCRRRDGANEIYGVRLEPANDLQQPSY
jgi:hypothetical protein